jgi:hypothetical protein
MCYTNRRHKNCPYKRKHPGYKRCHKTYKIRTSSRDIPLRGSLRPSLRDRCIRDRDWQEPVIRLIKRLNVPIVPVHFLDRNSDFYYTLGLIDWRIRLLRLPAEVFNKRCKKTRIALGEIITPSVQNEFTDLNDFTAFLRNKVYDQL